MHAKQLEAEQLKVDAEKVRVLIEEENLRSAKAQNAMKEAMLQAQQAGSTRQTPTKSAMAICMEPSAKKRSAMSSCVNGFKWRDLETNMPVTQKKQSTEKKKAKKLILPFPRIF